MGFRAGALPVAVAQDPAKPTPPTDEPAHDEPVATQPAQAEASTAGAAKTESASTLVRLAEDYAVWMDPKRKLVAVDGRICLREGQLELFACPKGTKEHESIVSVDCPAKFVHAALLAVGAVPGHPVQFDPVYRPASGPKVKVLVLWVDKDGKRHTARAQEWIRRVSTGEPMPYDFVFAGSGFVVDQHTGEKYYLAEGGELICVSNFATAMLDVPIESSQANADLLFEAFTEKIPPVKTKVRLVLIPEIKPPPKSQPSAGMPPDSASNGER